MEGKGQIHILRLPAPVEPRPLPLLPLLLLPRLLCMLNHRPHHTYIRHPRQPMTQWSES